VIPTFFKKDCTVNFEVLIKLIDKLAEWGYDKVVINGSTSEVVKLSVDERINIAEYVVENCKSKITIISGTGTPCAYSTISLIRTYRDLSINYILLTPPYYVKPSFESLEKFYDEVISKVDVNVILYNIPTLVGYELPISLIEKLINNYGQVIGVKDSSGNFRYFLELLHRLNGRVSILQGIDELLIPSLIMGCSGAIIASPNYLKDVPLRIYRLIESKNYDKVVELHRELMNLWLLIRGKWPSIEKKLTCEALGVCSECEREPIPKVSEEELDSILNVSRRIENLLNLS